jgi:hypothetical protein
MIKIKFLERSAGLIRSETDQSWLATPSTRAGSGPAGVVCLMCRHFDLSQSRWSDHGRCARRPDAAAAIAAAATRLDERIVERRSKIDGLRSTIKRLEGEIAELHEEQRDAQGARSRSGDSAEDSEWKEFEPDFRGDSP